MPQIRRSSTVFHNARQMYDIVLDVGAYPDFLPWCNRAQVRFQDDTRQEAEVGIAFKGFQQSFSTDNELITGSRIQMNLLHGPFKKLKGIWRFDGIDDESCEVSFELEFEFRNFLLAKAAGGIFSRIATEQLDAFIQRAQQLHG